MISPLPFEIDAKSLLGARYLQAKRYVSASGYLREIEWQASLDSRTYSESDFLREAAWVILCSGFRERIVRERFDYISLCFFDFEAAYLIARESERCIEASACSINHRGKLEAIAEIAAEVADQGFFSIKRQIDENPARRLEAFPFLGAVTSLHLAKNLGYQVCKPDRHLVKIAKKSGFETVDLLCGAIAEETGDSVSVVDIVLWRAATLLPRFPNWFALES